MAVQVQMNVALATTPLSEHEKVVLTEVREILQPVKDTTWSSGRAENADKGNSCSN